MEGAPHLHRSLDGRADTGIVAGAQCWWQHIKEWRTTYVLWLHRPCADQRRGLRSRDQVLQL